MLHKVSRSRRALSLDSGISIENARSLLNSLPYLPSEPLDLDRFTSNGMYKISKVYPTTTAKPFLQAFIGPEARLCLYVALLYAVFIAWGYLQEKIASSQYDETRWDHPFVLNAFMSLACCLTASLAGWAAPDDRGPGAAAPVPFKAFWKVAITSALASPAGYESLKYISFPMMILAKSCKHVPVMAIGVICYRKHYSWVKYISVAMVCTGVAVFTLAKSSTKVVNAVPLMSMLYGILLVMINLCLDGVTSNEQDQLFASHGTSSMEMMANTNGWQAIYLSGYLLLTFLTHSTDSSVYKAFSMLYACSELRVDILCFCFCACLGQLLLFALIREFGSLVWITVSVTRQLFTVMLSIFLFNHPVNAKQWAAVLLVFGGLLFEIACAYRNQDKGATGAAGAVVVETKRVDPLKMTAEHTSKKAL